MNSEPIYTRRSIRKFKSKNVEIELIDRILDAARMAPSAKNRQPWKYLVFAGRKKAELLEQMKIGIQREEGGEHSLPKSQFGIPDAKNTLKVMESAPVIIVVLNTNGKTPFTSLDADERFTEINDLLSIGASIENMILKADELGIGTLWIGNTCFAYSELLAYTGTKSQIVGAVAVGYADEQPNARPRKMLTDIVEYHVDEDLSHFYNKSFDNLLQ